MGVVKLVPVAMGVPPVGTSYQFTVPVFETALSITVPLPQRVAEVVAVMAAIVNEVLAEIFNVGSPGVPPYSTIYPLGW